MHNIGGRWLICKQRNHGEHRLNFSANPREILLFLAQNAMGSFMGSFMGPLRNRGTV
jgi:hypothetical protein